MYQILTELSTEVVPYDEGAVELYLQSASTRASIVAMCEGFRAGRTVDREHNAEDRRVGRCIECPTLVLWGQSGAIDRHLDVPAI